MYKLRRNLFQEEEEEEYAAVFVTGPLSTTIIIHYFPL
jgi:hypothetical protein